MNIEVIYPVISWILKIVAKHITDFMNFLWIKPKDIHIKYRYIHINI